MATWNVDAAHSNVQFKVKHLMINTVTGEFTDYSVTVASDKEDFSDASIVFEANVSSISTKNDMRDGHLKSDDFFAAETYPTMRFVSSSFTPKSDGMYELAGELTIRDVTKSVVLTAEFGGQMTDPYGNIKAGFDITGTINRKEFGLEWDAVTEAGGIVVSDAVKLQLNIQLQKS